MDVDDFLFYQSHFGLFSTVVYVFFIYPWL